MAILFFCGQALAACSPEGRIRNNAGNREFCNGTDWKQLGAPQFVYNGCPTPTGKIIYNNATARMEFCNNTTSMQYVTGCSDTGESCTGQIGKMRYDNVNHVMQYCRGTDPSSIPETWANMGNVAGNPCCPDGFLPVPHDAATLTTRDFCVSKYHMKAVRLSNGAVDANGSVGSLSDYFPQSRMDGRPWVRVSYNEAIDLCGSLNSSGNEYHLITNPEWMTIAKQIELNAANWSTGVVGGPGGHIPYGHSDGGPGATLDATVDASPCYGTNNLNCQVTSSADFSQKRTLNLNGLMIWDFAGNANSWVAPSISAVSNISLTYIYPNAHRPGYSCSTPTNTFNVEINSNCNTSAVSGLFINETPTLFPPAANNKFAFLPALDGVYDATPYSSRGFGQITWDASSLIFVFNFPLMGMSRGGYYSASIGSEIKSGIYSAFFDDSAYTSGLTKTSFRCVYQPAN